MRKMRSAILEEIAELNTSEKIMLVQAVWDQIASDPEEVPLSTAQQRELDRRLALYRQNPENTSSWEDIVAWLQSSQ